MKNTKKVFVLVEGGMCQGVYTERILATEDNVELEVIVLDSDAAANEDEDADFLGWYETNYKRFSEMLEQGKLEMKW